MQQSAESRQWEKIGGDGIRNSWNNPNLWINRSLGSDSKNLYATVGGEIDNTSLGYIWKYTEQNWVELPINDALNDGSYDKMRDNRSIIFKTNSDVFSAFSDHGKKSIILVSLNTFKIIEVHLADILKIKLTGGLSIKFATYHAGCIYLGGSVEVDNDDTIQKIFPYIIKYENSRFESLLSNHFPGADGFSKSVELPYSGLVSEGGLFVGSCHINTKFKGASVWMFTPSSGWRLLGGHGHLGSWGDRDSIGILSISIYRKSLIVTHFREQGTDPQFSSVWRFNGRVWEPIMVPGDSKNLASAIHFNSSLVFEDNFLVGIGSATGKNIGNNNTAVWSYCPDTILWKRIFNYEAVLSAKTSEKLNKTSRGKYIYDMTEYAGSLVVGLTSWSMEGQPAIWQLASET